MKKLSLFIIFALISTLLLCVADPDEILTKAVEAYNCDNYETAKLFFEKAIMEEGSRSGVAFYRYGYSVEQMYGVEYAQQIYLFAYLLLKEQEPDHRYLGSVADKLYGRNDAWNAHAKKIVEIVDTYIPTKRLPFDDNLGSIVLELLRSNTDSTLAGFALGITALFPEEIVNSSSAQEVLKLALQNERDGIAATMLKVEGNQLLTGTVGAQAIQTVFERNLSETELGNSFLAAAKYLDKTWMHLVESFSCRLSATTTRTRPTRWLT